MKLDRKKLACLMIEKGLDCSSMAKQSGVSTPTITRLVSKEQNVKFKTIGSICRTLEVKPQDIIKDF